MPIYSGTVVKDFLRPMKILFKNAITNLNSFPEILTVYYPHLRKEKIPNMLVTLAGDGVKIIDAGVHKNMYLYLMCPLDWHYPNAPLHIETYPLGAAPKNIIDLFQIISKKLLKFNITVKFIATDSETSTNYLHTNFFNANILPHLNDDFISLVHGIQECVQIPVSDLLHLFKNARANILRHMKCVNLASLIVVNMDE